MGSNLQLVFPLANAAHVCSLKQSCASHCAGTIALSHVSVGIVCSLSCMYMAKATAFVSAVEAVMQVYVGNRDSKLLHVQNLQHYGFVNQAALSLFSRRSVALIYNSALQAHVLQAYTSEMFQNGYITDKHISMSQQTTIRCRPTANIVVALYTRKLRFASAPG